MLKFAALALLAVAQLPHQYEATLNPKTVCYYESWVHWRKGDGKIDINELDPTVCTHFVYSYMGIDAGSHEVKLLDAYLMNDLHDLDHFTQAKGKSKALIAVGGSSASAEYSPMSATAQGREAFVNSVIRLLATHNFDGIIIDWYNMPQGDGANLLHLLDKFDEKFASTSYTLAITLPVTEATYDWYNVAKIAQYVDFINVITMDYAGSWGKTVGHASPITSQLKTLEAYHARGAPRSKLLMSVPLYARTWKLASAAKQQVGDEAVSAGTKGPYTDVDGILSYNELCVLITNNPTAFSLQRDPVEMAVHAIYSHSGTYEWITFEDTKTLAEKAKNITQMGFAGMTTYTLSNEDVHGVCGKKFPLLHAINDNYDHTAVADKPSDHPVTNGPGVIVNPTQPTGPVTPVPGTHCPNGEGKYRDHTYCYTYYDCVKGDFGAIEAIELHCDRSQAFDEVTKTCVDKSHVAGC